MMHRTPNTKRKNTECLQRSTLVLFGVDPRPKRELKNEELACFGEHNRSLRTNRLHTHMHPNTHAPESDADRRWLVPLFKTATASG